MLVLTALALLTASAAENRLTAMSTRELAAKYLPRRTARRIVTHEFLPNSRVLLSTNPTPTPDGFCERDQFLVPAGSPSKMTLSADIYRGDCPADGIAGFVHVNPNAQLHVAQAKLAVLWLEGAIAAARARMPLPFDVDCVAEAQRSSAARGNGETTPLTVGFSNSSALPPPGDFISRSAISVISSSVATGWVMRLSSPAQSSCWMKVRKESKAMRRD